MRVKDKYKSPREATEIYIEIDTSEEDAKKVKAIIDKILLKKEVANG